MKRFQKFPLLRLPTALSVSRRLYLLFLIQNSVVTNSREDIAENIIEYMYQITCNYDLIIKLRKIDLAKAESGGHGTKTKGNSAGPGGG